MAERTVRSDADPDAMATVVISSLRGTAFQWLLEPDDFDIESALSVLAATVSTLLAANTGG